MPKAVMRIRNKKQEKEDRSFLIEQNSRTTSSDDDDQACNLTLLDATLPPRCVHRQEVPSDKSRVSPAAFWSGYLEPLCDGEKNPRGGKGELEREGEE
ncbi:hypothetical protein KQX54_020323 [Cotesia glomerata]|uniref:Uncharacterized protein n=1 Tax=Cotesia glomerata TaxID=32391 RepID=A0AAV7I2T7_COTGL|nr:hypothetical protein KQX54_020323 [Cotesia glomerata]